MDLMKLKKGNELQDTFKALEAEARELRNQLKATMPEDAGAINTGGGTVYFTKLEVNIILQKRLDAIKEQLEQVDFLFRAL